jgi:hypothetical protein
MQFRACPPKTYVRTTPVARKSRTGIIRRLRDVGASPNGGGSSVAFSDSLASSPVEFCRTIRAPSRALAAYAWSACVVCGSAESRPALLGLRVTSSPKPRRHMQVGHSLCTRFSTCHETVVLKTIASGKTTAGIRLTVAAATPPAAASGACRTRRSKPPVAHRRGADVEQASRPDQLE